MKNIIVHILTHGYTTSKKYTVEDLCKKLFLLRDLIFYDDSVGMIRCNNNKFWHHENSENRIALFHDVYSVHRFDIMDSMYFHILNRHANGDGYGIVSEG